MAGVMATLVTILPTVLIVLTAVMADTTGKLT
jgi:hypothetical protein